MHCGQISIEFQHNNSSLPQADVAEKVSNILLKPWRLFNGKTVTVSQGSPYPYQQSEKQRLIMRIFFAAITVLLTPLFLIGIGIAALSRSHAAMYCDYMKNMRQQEDSFMEVFNRIERDLKRDLPLVEEVIFQKYKELPAMLQAMPSKVDDFRDLLCSAFITQQERNPTVFRAPQVERNLLSFLGFEKTSDYADRNRIFKRVKFLRLPYKNVEKIEVFKKRINELASEERLKEMGLSKKQIGRFAQLLEKYEQERDIHRKFQPVIIDELTKNIHLPLAKKNLIEDIKNQFNVIVNAGLRIKLVEKREQLRAFLSSSSSTLTTIFPKGIVENELMITSIVENLDRFFEKQIEWLEKYQAEFVKEFIQGNENPDQALDNGVCYALAVRMACSILENPLAPLENMSIGEIDPADRFLQAHYNQTNVTERVSYLKTFTKNKFAEHFFEPPVEIEEEMTTAIVRYLTEEERENTTIILRRAQHATVMRFDRESNQFWFFDPNFGMLRFTRKAEESDRDLAGRVAQCWFELYKVFYDPEGKSTLLCEKIEKIKEEIAVDAQHMQ